MKKKNNKKIKAVIIIACLLFVITTVVIARETQIFAKEETLAPLGASAGATDSNTHIGGNTSKQKLYENYKGAWGVTSTFFGDIWIAQAFTVGTVGDNEQFIITRIGMYGYKNGNPGDLTVDLQAVDITGKPNGKILTTGTVLEADAPDGFLNVDWFYVKIIGYKLQPNIQYAIVCHADDGTGVNNYQFQGVNPGTYAGGNFSRSLDDGATWAFNPLSIIDQQFEVWGKSASTSIRILGGHIGGGG